jgi:hypothetical protein
MTARYITEVNIEDEIFWLISDTNGGFYAHKDADTAPATFTATTSSGSPTLTSVSSFTGRYIGQSLSGTGIAAGARILSLNSGASEITMTANATASNSGVTITVSALAKIIDADFPSNHQGPFVELDGTIYIGTTAGTIRGSDLNSITAWSATNDIQTSDSSIVVTKHNDQIAAIGRNKITFYYNAGNAAGSLLSRSSSPEINMGTSDFNNVRQFRDWTFFIGQDTGPETSGIWMLDGFAVKRLTSIPLTRMLSQNEASLNANVVTLSAFEHQGKQFVHFGMGTSSAVTASYLYCLESQEWVESGYPYLLLFSEGLNAISLSNTSGIIYTANPLTPTYQDVGSVAYTATIQTSLWDGETNNDKFIKSVSLIADNQASGDANISWSVNDYASYGANHPVNMTRMNKTVYDGPSGKRFSFKITHAANTPFRAEAIEVVYEEGDT